MFLKSNLRRTFRSSKACQGSSRGGAFMVALKNGERTNGSFSTDTRFFVCLLLFPPLRRPIWPISWALSRNSGFFPPAEKGGGESRRAKAKAPPPFCFPCRSVCFFPLFANGLAPPPMPICQIYGASGGGTEKRRRRRERKGGSTPNNQAESDTFSCIPSSANS